MWVCWTDASIEILNKEQNHQPKEMIKQQRKRTSNSQYFNENEWQEDCSKHIVDLLHPGTCDYLFFWRQCWMNKFPVQEAGAFCVWRQQPSYKSYFEFIVEWKPRRKRAVSVHSQFNHCPWKMLSTGRDWPVWLGKLLLTKKSKDQNTSLTFTDISTSMWVKLYLGITAII